MNIRLFAASDLKSLSLQSAQADFAEVAGNAEYGASLEALGPAFTFVDGSEVIGCLGVVEHHSGRAETWALLSGRAGPWMRRITKAAAGWFLQTEYARIEAHVATDFDAGHRWAKLLGFSQEGPERKCYFQDGRSAITYVRFKDGAVCGDSRHGSECDWRTAGRRPEEG